jgi:GT2 family glycosyltransferase
MESLFPMYVVIPNWNLKSETIECVASVLTAAGNDDVSIVVVDNGSTDGSLEALAKAFGERITQLQMGQNRGFAGAVNAGISYALERGAVSVLVLNNDTTVDREMLKILSCAARKHPDAGILAPAIYRMDTPAHLWRMGDRQGRWSFIPYKISGREATAEIVEVDYVTGCGMLIRRETIEAVGLFDEQFFMYYEDADFCKRVRDRGFRILCVPAARMWHKVSLTARRDMTANLYWRARGQVLFYRKHMRRDISWLLHFYLGSKAILSVLRYGLQRQWQYGRSVLLGTLDGYRIPLHNENEG